MGACLFSNVSKEGVVTACRAARIATTSNPHPQ